MRIRVGDHRIPFNIGATRWLGIYLDSRLSFTEHARISARRARAAERRLTSMVARHGVPPLSARHLQEAIVGSTLMFGAEVTWRGQKGMRDTFQVGINRMSRATLGVLPSTPVSFLQAEGGSVPAEVRLRGRQEAFANRLATRREGRDGLLQMKVGLGMRLRNIIEEGGDGGVEGVEETRHSRGLSFPGVVAIPAIDYDEKDKVEIAKAGKEEAEAMGKDMNTIWTDGSRQRDGRVGVGIAWLEGPREESGRRLVTKRRDFRTAGQRKDGRGGYLGVERSLVAHQPGWRSNGFRLGGGREAYDAEVAAIVYAMVHFEMRGQEGHDYTIFTDSTAAM